MTDAQRAAALADIERTMALVKEQMARTGRGDHEGFIRAYTLASACVTRHAPPGSEYVRILARLERDPSPLKARMGVLMALHDAVENGHLRDFAERVHADLFADFLGQAQELNRQGYRLAAAVVAGAALEEHLRKLAEKNGIEIRTDNGKPRRAAELNEEIYKADVYGNAERAAVQSHQAIRNAAAHAEPDFDSRFNETDVRRLCEAIADFIAKYPA